ncbi:MAG: dockerin type I domain-containing protein [Clostridiales bacterium]|jgi:hypothetical protein|nr:dockerin type I domain-containing protein [Clostridiales bacterium]
MKNFFKFFARKAASCALALVMSMSLAAAAFGSDTSVSEPGLSAYPFMDIDVGSAAGRPGYDVYVDVSLTYNADSDISKDFAGFTMELRYDTSALEPFIVMDGTVVSSVESNVSQGAVLDGVVRTAWANSSNVTGTGVLYTVGFNIKETAAVGDTTLTLSKAEFFNQEMDLLPYINLINGSVNVSKVAYGDINGDNNVNTRDLVMLSQILAGWSLKLTDEQVAAADVHYDGIINTRDAIKLSQYLAGWSGILLGPSSGGQPALPTPTPPATESEPTVTPTPPAAESEPTVTPTPPPATTPTVTPELEVTPTVAAATATPTPTTAAAATPTPTTAATATPTPSPTPVATPTTAAPTYVANPDPITNRDLLLRTIGWFDAAAIDFWGFLDVEQGTGALLKQKTNTSVDPYIILEPLDNGAKDPILQSPYYKMTIKSTNKVVQTEALKETNGVSSAPVSLADSYTDGNKYQQWVVAYAEQVGGYLVVNRGGNYSVLAGDAASTPEVAPLNIPARCYAYDLLLTDTSGDYLPIFAVYGVQP